MLIFPELIIPQTLLLQHPLWGMLFLLATACPAFFYLRLVFKCEDATIIRLFHIAMVLAALSHLLLIAILCLALLVIQKSNVDHLRSRETTKMLAAAAGLIALLTIAWTLAIILLGKHHPDLHSGLLAIFRKLFNYPRLYEKVVIPFVQGGVLLETVLAACGAFAILLRPPATIQARRAAGFFLCLILLCLSASGIAKTLYNHIRYFYYLYPLLLLLAAFFLVQTGRFLAQRSRIGLTVFGLFCLGFLGWNLSTVWTEVITSKTGATEKFGFARVHLDHRTCCDFLQQQRTSADFLVDFGRPNETAVYCGGINASLRPALQENRGRETHYITGSQLFDSPQELNALLQEKTTATTKVWLMSCQFYLPQTSWAHDLLALLAKNQVCQAADNNTVLYSVTSSDLQKLLH